MGIIRKNRPRGRDFATIPRKSAVQRLRHIFFNHLAGSGNSVRKKKSNSNGCEHGVKANCRPFSVFMSSLHWMADPPEVEVAAFFLARPCPGINYCRSLNTLPFTSERPSSSSSLNLYLDRNLCPWRLL